MLLVEQICLAVWCKINIGPGYYFDGWPSSESFNIYVGLTIEFAFHPSGVGKMTSIG